LEEKIMLDLTWACDLAGKVLPFEAMQAKFMQQALIGLILLAPMCAVMGVQVVNSRMAFFSDAISHSAFAGIAIGLIFSFDIRASMILFALIVGIGITLVGRRTDLSSDTVIGVFFSVVIAFGLAIVSRNPSITRDLQRFFYGDILTIGNTEILWTLGLFLLVAAFQFFGYNRLLFCGLNSQLASAYGVKTGFYEYVFAALLSLVVIFSVWAMGVLLVTALLIVPAAAARNFARSVGGMFWWATFISLFSAVAGLLVSAQDWAHSSTGATIILVAAAWFLFSCIPSLLRKSR
jgi:zinc transport system permease protein